MTPDYNPEWNNGGIPYTEDWDEPPEDVFESMKIFKPEDEENG